MSNKVVLVTGASSGMGKATAIHLNKAGYIVYAGARRIERMKHLEQQGIHVLNLDVIDDKSMVLAIETIIKEQGRIDILVNNAGYGSYGAVEDVPMSEAKYQFEVNVFGMARLIQLVLPYMRSNRFGKIVNISSVGAKTYEPLGAWYHSTKYAVEGLSDCLRLEVEEFGIDVIIIEPGGIKTEWAGIAADNLLRTSGDTVYGDLAKKYANALKQGNMGTNPDIIAQIIEKAISVKKPKTRYAAGFGATFFLFARKILPDRLYDKFWMFIIKNTDKMMPKK